MTYSQVYVNGKDRLASAGIESPAFDTMCIFEAVFGFNRQKLAVHGSDQAPNADIVTFNTMIQQRCARRPLQYIIGEWSFLDLTLELGEGVLIAREDTEVLVRTAEEKLRGRVSPYVIDLCAGTGAVGLGLASLNSQARVDCVEYFDIPMSYLMKNIEKNGMGERVRAVRANVLEMPPEELSQADAILSNPPYIESEVISTLQEEVQQEPVEALDGGADGLDFYRAIAQNWVPKLKPKGLIALEVGEGQAEQVAELLKNADVTDIGYSLDFNGIHRVVYGFAAGEAEQEG